MMYGVKYKWIRQKYWIFATFLSTPFRDDVVYHRGFGMCNSCVPHEKRLIYIQQNEWLKINRFDISWKYAFLLTLKRYSNKNSSFSNTLHY